MCSATTGMMLNVLLFMYTQKKLEETVDDLTTQLKMKEIEIKKLKENNKLLSKKRSEAKIMQLKKTTDKVRTLVVKQYRSMLYCVLCLSVLQYIAILQYLIGLW